jgi:membrane-bound lytic murein transglycosylase A
MPRTALLALVLALACTACSRKPAPVVKDYDRPLGPGEVALVELDQKDWPVFTTSGMDRTAFLAAIEHSLSYLSKPSSGAFFPVAGVDKAGTERGLRRFAELLRSNASDATIQETFKREFRVFSSIGWDRQGTVLFTGYYTPIFDARMQPDAVYKYPIHMRPADLRQDPTGKQIAQRDLGGGRMAPYSTAAELLASGELKGRELAWFADPFDAYIVVVQGSARLRLADGSIKEVGFDGTNGHPYRAIAKDLIADGKIRKEDLNLATLRRHFREHPGDVAIYTSRNPRYVFFKERPGGPFGSLNTPVTTDVSIAADKQIFPRGALTFVTTESPNRGGQILPYAAFRLDQDNGGAIQAPGRSDLYMGVGEQAERRAGFQYAEGRLYYIIAK